jgi:hypothetical protein
VQRQLEERLERARNRGDAGRQEVTLLVHLATYTSRSKPIQDIIQRLYSQLLGISGRERPLARDLVEAINQAREEIDNVSFETIDRLARDVVRINNDSHRAVVPVGSLRDQIGPVFDAFGNRVPPAGRVPDIRDGTSTLSEIIEKAALLFFINGQSDVTHIPAKRTDVLSRPADRQLTGGSLDGTTGPAWNRKVKFAVAAALTGLATKVLSDARNDKDPSAALKKALGVRVSARGVPLSGSTRRAGGGLLAALENIYRHEAMRMHSDYQSEIHSEAAGYTLWSAQVATSDPEHVRNHGNVYYKDNRPGSTASWADRIDPPYRANCLCYKTYIYDDGRPENEVEWEAFPMKRKGKGSILHIRDVAEYARWFGKQKAEVQQTIMGTKLWLSAALVSSGKPRYNDFVGTNGRILTASQISSETPAERSDRSKTVLNMFSQMSRSDTRLPASEDSDVRKQIAKLVKSGGVR